MPPALEHTQKLMAFVLISDALEKEGAGERVKWVDLCSQVGCKKAQIYRMRKNMQLYGTQGESTMPRGRPNKFPEGIMEVGR